MCSKCPQRHLLKKFITPSRKYRCDACETTQQKNVLMHSCDDGCNYRLCDACNTAAVDDAMAAAPAELSRLQWRSRNTADGRQCAACS
eukprot:gene56608-biopygen113748